MPVASREERKGGGERPSVFGAIAGGHGLGFGQTSAADSRPTAGRPAPARRPGSAAGPSPAGPVSSTTTIGGVTILSGGVVGYDAIVVSSGGALTLSSGVEVSGVTVFAGGPG